MAAGIGSRFGEGIKQLTPLGPNDEIIMDYSIKGAIDAGVDEVVIVIRKDIEKEFREIIGNRIEKKVKCRYAFQELNMLPNEFKVPKDRVKPYGTAHAIYCAKEYIDSSFIVINADDYYGTEGFKKVHDYLISSEKKDSYDMCMAGYLIGNTLSENGTVTRGLCKQDDKGYLTDVVETYEVSKKSDGKITGEDDKKNEVVIKNDDLVSMNMFGFTPQLFTKLERDFPKFLDNHKEDIEKCEYLIPTLVFEQIEDGEASVEVLETDAVWQGITYREDKEKVVNEIKKLVDNGEYPKGLW